MSPATDYISGLPESLTTSILSLVPLKDAVRTSVLARSWRYAWRTRTNIEVTDSNFPSPQNCLLFTRDLVSRYPHATIDRFAFTLSTAPPDVDTHAFLTTFIDFAVAHSTKALEISHPGPTFELPDSIYPYYNLEHLKLDSCSFEPEDFENMTGLKTLSLGSMDLPSAALKSIIRECRDLESLSLVRCREATVITVALPKLKSLVIEGCIDLLHLTVISHTLTRIKYVGALIGFGMLLEMKMLEEAEFDLRDSPFFDDEENGENVQRMIIYCKNAKILRVCSYITQVLATASAPWALCCKLKVKHLVLKSALQKHENIGISCLLRSSPFIEKLQIDICRPPRLYEDDEDFPGSEVDPQKFWGEYLEAPKCVKKSVKEVEINGFRGSDNEIRFLKFLVDYGEKLQSVRLKLARDNDAAWKQTDKDMRRILNTWRRKLAKNFIIVMV